MSDTNSIEKRMVGSVMLAADSDFIDSMRHHAALGVGYGFMQQVIEWEWQDRDEFNGAWGPEYYEAEIKRLSTEHGVLCCAIQDALHCLDAQKTPSRKALEDALATVSTRHADE